MSPSPERARRARYRRLRNGFARWALPFFHAILGATSYRWAQRMGRALGALAWRLGRRDRERALDHLALAFPELAPEERERLGRASFLANGMNLTELFHLTRRDLAHAMRFVTVEGLENLPVASGRPVLIITGHCGNWELLSPVCQRHGVPMAAVVRPLDDAWAEDLAVEMRRHFGAKVIQRGTRSSVRQLLQVMRGAEALVMLIDQDIRADSVFVPFFGRLARTPSGPAEIALRRDMIVVPFFTHRRPDGTHVARFHPPLELPDDLTAATARMTRAVEEQIRRQPDQWVWMHRRWRHRPPGEEPATSPHGGAGGSPS